MIKKLIICFISIIGIVTSQKCFINSDITNSQKLFTYAENVYDITGYSHPGGSTTLKKTVGDKLEDYVTLPKYDFHLTSNKFKSDLKKMYVGVLKDTCTQTTTQETNPTTEETNPKTQDTTQEINPTTQTTTQETNPTTEDTTQDTNPTNDNSEYNTPNISSQLKYSLGTVFILLLTISIL